MNMWSEIIDKKHYLIIQQMESMWLIVYKISSPPLLWSI